MVTSRGHCSGLGQGWGLSRLERRGAGLGRMRGAGRPATSMGQWVQEVRTGVAPGRLGQDVR